MKKVDPTFVFFMAFVATLITICIVIGSGILIDNRDWRRVYKSADDFEFVRQSPLLTVFILRDKEGNDICEVCIDEITKSSFVMRDNEIVLYSTNRYYSIRLAKKLLKKLPENPREVFQNRTFEEFEKHLKEYYKNNDKKVQDETL